MMPAEITPNLVGFSCLASLTILAALGVVTSKSPMRSALCLVATFASIAIFYFTLQATFLGITQLTVYAGAIMVLFLFILIILNVGPAKKVKTDPKVPVAVLVGLGIFLSIAVQLYNLMKASPWPVNAPQGYGEGENIGKVLFTSYAYPFEAISVLLLIGIVGSILLAKRRLR